MLPGPVPKHNGTQLNCSRVDRGVLTKDQFEDIKSLLYTESRSFRGTDRVPIIQHQCMAEAGSSRLPTAKAPWDRKPTTQLQMHRPHGQTIMHREPRCLVLARGPES